MRVDIADVRKIVERVCARPDVLDACRKRDLGIVIEVLGSHGLTQGTSAGLQVAASTVSVLIKPQIKTRRRNYMTAIIFILVAGTVIALIGTAAFVLIVITSQTVDLSKRLMPEARNVLVAATRRILGTCMHSSGVRQMKES